MKKLSFSSLCMGDSLFGEVCHDSIEVVLLTWVFFRTAEPINLPGNNPRSWAVLFKSG
jgi:hypothetical protein